MNVVETIPQILGSFGIIVATYFVVAIGLLYLMQPLRERMVEVSESILAESKWSDRDREEVNLLIDTCWSFRVGLLVPLAILRTMLEDIIGREYRVCEGSLHSDSRFGELCALYFACVLANNPLAALMTVPLMAVGILVRTASVGFAKFRRNGAYSPSFLAEVRDYVEEPLARAAHGMAVTA